MARRNRITPRGTRTGWVLGFVGVVLLPTSANAATINVCWDHSGDYLTIQEGIDAAVDGDEVVVCPGTYTGTGNRDLDYGGKAITVRSTDPEDPDVVAATVIDCQGNAADPHRGLKFHSNEGVDSVLAGITVTNGYGPNEQIGGLSRPLGGAVFCTGSSSPTFEYCMFSGNSAPFGGGMYNGYASPTLANCTFTGNSAAHLGGGMWNLGGSPTLKNCMFTGNSAALGGAMYGVHASPTLTNCTFTGNSAAHLGGGMWNYGGSPTLVNCTFRENLANEGGGMSNHSSSPTLTNCTFTGNSADSQGGGMWNYGGSPTLTNCILWGNTSPSGPQLGNGDCLPMLRYCDIGGSGGSEKWNHSLGTDGGGNIDADPLFTPDGHLGPGSPCIDAGDNLSVPLIVTGDTDGDSRFVNDPNVEDTGNGTPPIVDMGADEFLDTDGDGLPDWWEAAYPTAADPGGDPDNDGLTNLQEYEQYSSDPSAIPIYVDANNPNDPDEDGSIDHPFDTIQEGINAAGDGDTVLVLESTYTGEGNRNLDYGGKSVIVRSWDGIDPLLPANATMNCGGLSQAVNPDSIKGTFASLESVTILNGQADRGGGILTDRSRLMLKNCVLANNTADTEGGGIYSDLSNPTIDDLTIQTNTSPDNDGDGVGDTDAGIVRYSNVHLQGDLRVEAGILDVQSSWFYGPGSIDLADETLLSITGTPGDPATVVRSDISGLGDINIPAGLELDIEGGAVVDLSAGAGGTCANGCVATTEPEDWGTITVGGVLVVRNATVRNANIEVTLANVEGGTSIINNDIRIMEATTGFGGQFFVEGSTSIECNSIFSQGDRYLDFDPDPADRNLNICGNEIHVTIDQGQLTDRGTLLELRARDYECEPGGMNYPKCESGAWPATVTGRFADPDEEPAENWVLETLEILPGAKLNLTNRPGFQYQTDLTYPETVYVKNLILRENAVLNTALQTLYYETLTQEDGSEIVDEPLLGFSLGIIAMDDTTDPPHDEFTVRVRTRLRDSTDQQDCRCDGVCPNNSPPQDPFICMEGSVERLSETAVQQEIPTLDVGGVMDMRTQHPAKQPASSVAAKGAFARAGDEDIVVTFDYLFRQTEPGTKINIYLSDKPDVGNRIFKVAELTPPPANMPGGTSSSRLALFRGEFPRVVGGENGYELNFTRGTYVELELVANEDEQGTRTPGAAHIWVDNFDPQVVCPEGMCGVFRPSPQAEPEDYLVLLAETGRSVPDGKWCLDMSRDGYVDLRDLLAWDLYYNVDAELCPDSAGAAGPTQNAQPAQTTTTLAGDGLLIAGKPDLDVNHENAQKDFLYNVTTGGVSLSPGQSVTCLPGMDCDYGLARLVKDANDTMYAVHGVHGVVRQDTGEVVVGPRSQTFDGKTVIIGGVYPDGDYYGVPLSDAAFAPDDTGPAFIYVVPVLVTVPAAGQTPEHTYKAAAKLELLEGGNFNVAAIFGSDPYAPDADDCANCRLIVPGGDCTPLCDLTNVREIEVDADKNVFVASGTQYNRINDWILIYDGGGTLGSEIARVNLNDMFADNPDLVPSAPGALFVSSDNHLYLTSSANMGNGLLTYVYRFAIGVGATSLIFDGIMAIDNPIPTACSDPDITCDDGHVSSITSIQQAPDGTLYVVGFTAPKFRDDEPLPTSIDGIFTTPTLTMIPPGTAWSSPPEVLPPDFDNDGDVDQYDVEAFEACSSGPGIPYTGDCKEKDRDADGDVDQNDFGFLQRCFTGDQIPADRSCLPPSGISATPITGSDLALPISALFVQATQ